MELIQTFKAGNKDVQEVLVKIMDQMPKNNKYFATPSYEDNTVSKIKEFISNLLKEEFSKEDEKFNIEFGEVFNAYGIGNNKRYPIILKNETKEIQFGYVHINNDMFGREILVLSDNDDKKVADSFKYEDNLI